MVAFKLTETAIMPLRFGKILSSFKVIHTGGVVQLLHVK